MRIFCVSLFFSRNKWRNSKVFYCYYYFFIYVLFSQGVQSINLENFIKVKSYSPHKPCSTPLRQRCDSYYVCSMQYTDYIRTLAWHAFSGRIIISNISNIFHQKLPNANRYSLFAESICVCVEYSGV